MKTERNILIAFILNLTFSVFEFFGGIFCGSVAILSDALHDMGDAVSIGISFFLEKKSRQAADENYTYGYTRYSVLGGVITTTILVLGSAAVIYNAIKRMFCPVEINYEGMILFGVVGICVNFLAAYFTREKGSVNQRAINLHMLEDVLGWIVVLAGAVIMKFTDIRLIDPIISLGVAMFILVCALRNLKEAVFLFLERVPSGIELGEVRERILAIEGVIDVHHIHIWSLDDRENCATMHIVTNADSAVIKEKVRGEMFSLGISHATLEIEQEGERCPEENCLKNKLGVSCCHHH